MRKNQTFRWVAIFFVFSFCFVTGSVWAATVAPLNVNNGHTRTATRRVTLKIHAPKDSRLMKISNDEKFTDVSWEKVVQQKTWYLNYGSGSKKIYIKFRDSRGKESSVSHVNIYLTPPATFKSDFEINDGDEIANTRSVELHFNLSAGIESIQISNNSNFSDAESFTPEENLTWTLTSGTGKKTVFVKFTDVSNKTHILSHSIQYTEPARYIPEETVIKGQSETLYYLGLDGKMHPFLDLATYHSWYKDFSKVVYVSDAKIQEYSIGSAVCLRAGTWLVKFSHSPRIYAVEPGCRLRPLRSETEAFIFYGDTWQRRIVELSDIQRNFYRVSDITPYEDSEDRDQDGVPVDMEDLYSTSDNRADTDRDGVSDYEEIYAWFSDPLKKDTNSNGTSDSQEVRKGLSPVSSQILTTLPEGSYTLPVGTLFQTVGANKSSWYYQYTPEYAGGISESTFKTYNAPTTFISRTPFAFVLPRRSIFSSTDVKIQFTPNMYHGSVLRPL